MSKPERIPHLRTANLNLVPVLRALLRESSVTRAAASLGLSPSATSCALGDLRRLLNDPLLISTGRGMRLTPRAEGIAGKLEHACLALEDLLRTDEFAPAECRRTFIIVAPDYVPALIGQRLVERIRAVAPHVRIRFVDASGSLEKDLESGTVDLGIVAINLLKWHGISSGASHRDHLVGLVAASHPLAGCTKAGAAELERFAKIDWGLSQSLSERVASAQVSGSPYRESAVLVAESHAVLPFLILNTDLVAIVPAAFARYVANLLPVRSFELPEPTHSYETSSLWSRLQDGDPAHSWFRSIVLEALDAAYG